MGTVKLFLTKPQNLKNKRSREILLQLAKSVFFVLNRKTKKFVKGEPFLYMGISSLLFCYRGHRKLIIVSPSWCNVPDFLKRRTEKKKKDVVTTNCGSNFRDGIPLQLQCLGSEIFCKYLGHLYQNSFRILSSYYGS